VHLECALLIGTRSAEGIKASGHVNRINTHGCTDQQSDVTISLANQEPSFTSFAPTV